PRYSIRRSVLRCTRWSSDALVHCRIDIRKDSTPGSAVRSYAYLLQSRVLAVTALRGAGCEPKTACLRARLRVAPACVQHLLSRDREGAEGPTLFRSLIV